MDKVGLDKMGANFAFRIFICLKRTVTHFWMATHHLRTIDLLNWRDCTT